MKKNNYLMRQFKKKWLSVSFIGYLGGLLLFCYDFLNSGCLLSLAAIIPIKSYSNAEVDKSKILKENQNKSGIYMWTNLINDKQYIGSAVDLSNRFSFYYSTTSMENALKRGISHIYRALLKNGHSNFSITILEYCSPDKCLIREKHYLDIFNPDYNIAKNPTAPFFGRTHSDETKTILSDVNTGENNPMFGKNHKEETKTILSEQKKGENNPNYGKKVEGSGKPSQIFKQ